MPKKYKAVEEAGKLAYKQTALLRQAMNRRKPTIKIATPAVKIDGRLKERIEAAVHTVVRRDTHFRRLKFTPNEEHLAAWILNAMLEAHGSVHAQMLHPQHGQYDATAAEAARSFVRSFAARHKIKGVEYDKAFYK